MKAWSRRSTCATSSRFEPPVCLLVWVMLLGWAGAACDTPDPIVMRRFADVGSEHNEQVLYTDGGIPITIRRPMPEPGVLEFALQSDCWTFDTLQPTETRMAGPQPVADPTQPGGLSIPWSEAIRTSRKGLGLPGDYVWDLSSSVTCGPAAHACQNFPLGRAVTRSNPDGTFSWGTNEVDFLARPDRRNIDDLVVWLFNTGVQAALDSGWSYRVVDDVIEYSFPPADDDVEARSLAMWAWRMGEAVREFHSWSNEPDQDGDGLPDPCVDQDTDGVPDSVDNCVTVANQAQVDSDDDGIGDACCGLDDPDGNGLNNCDWTPPHLRGAQPPELGSPETTRETWPNATPGETVCVQGVRACLPTGTWRGDLSPEQLASILGDWLRGRNLPPRPPHLPQHAPWPPWTELELGGRDLKVAECSVADDQRRAATGNEWSDDQWQDCLAEAEGNLVVDLPAPPIGRPAHWNNLGMRNGFGLVGEGIVYVLGYALNRNDCRGGVTYNVLLDGRPRKGEIDIRCEGGGGRMRELVEVKWYQTTYTAWPMNRVRSYYDQIRRHHKYWEQFGASTSRLVWMFGFTPPPIARDILEQSFRLPADVPPYDFKAVRGLGPLAGILDRVTSDAWSVGRAYWTRFIPAPFTYIPLVMDDGVCSLCKPDDQSIVCAEEFSFLGINVSLGKDFYIPRHVLRRWLGRYVDQCVRRRVAQGCSEGLQALYDKLGCLEY